MNLVLELVITLNWMFHCLFLPLKIKGEMRISLIIYRPGETSLITRQSLFKLKSAENIKVNLSEQ